MRGCWVITLAGLLAFAGPAEAQMHGGHHSGTRAAPVGPYAGLEQRSIKALSEEQVTDLRAGRGMGLALAAELNGYPGPLHVFEMADALGLTDDQRTRTMALFEAMKAETVPLGERVVEEETALDRLFAERRVTSEALTAATTQIGILQGRLRAAHLRYHLTTHDLLTPDQVARYNDMRGYRERP